jgi:hypothetical protein
MRWIKEDGQFSRSEEKPSWSEDTYFTDHSYRGFAADPERHELLLLNIHADTDAQFASHRDSSGTWHARGKIDFPIRAAYPQVALRNRAAHVLAVGDIQEPNPEWRELKFKHLQREWDYVFRRLFYAFTPELDDAPFSAPLEVDTVECTAGEIRNLDLHVDATGTAHLLYLKNPHVHTFLRDKYFAGDPFCSSLEYVTIRDGEVVRRRTLCKTPEIGGGIEPAYARFHVGLCEQLYVVVAGTRTSAGSDSSFDVCCFCVEAPDELTSLSLKHPFRTFFTNSPRGGSQPSNDLDLFGIADDAPKLRYAHVQIDVNKR